MAQITNGQHMQRASLAHRELREFMAHVSAVTEILDAERQRIEKERDDALAKVFGIRPSDVRVSSCWTCADSSSELLNPLGTCIYDLGSDMGLDECLICSEPNERK